jgi:hypothetical protein
MANFIDPQYKSDILTTMDKHALSNIIEIHLNKNPFNPAAKEALIKDILTTIPALSETEILKIYRNQEHNHYSQLKRIPAEALVNKINDESEALKSRILAESSKDITDQVKIINEVNKNMAAINRLTDMSPKIEINFVQEIPMSELINNAEVIIPATPNQENINEDNDTHN